MYRGGATQLIMVQNIKLEKEYLRTAAASGDDMHKPCQKVFISKFMCVHSL
jgi:hypothetical protein